MAVILPSPPRCITIQAKSVEFNANTMEKPSNNKGLRKALQSLYTGHDRRASNFRYALITFDIATIVYFILTAAAARTLTLTAINFVVGLLILLDFSARIWIADNRRRVLLRVYTLADLVVIVSLFLGPVLAENLALFRVLRGLRLIHSYHLLYDLRRNIRFFRVHEDAIFAGVNLFVFIFVTTSVVYVLRFQDASGVANYIDALYFTVATLTTTGFGDITLATPLGKILSVFIMIFGVALFVRLAQTIFQPAKIKYACQDCGLSRHEPDAVHCKHCGRTLRIATEGRD